MSIQYTLGPVLLNRLGVPGIPWGSEVTILDVHRQFKRKGMVSIKPSLMTDGDRVLVLGKNEVKAWVNAEDLANKP